MSLKLNIIICIAAILSLVVPVTADNNTAIVHGEVYSLETFEPLDNAVIYVNSTPSQSMVAKYGMYSFELEPGDYTVTAKYYQNSTVIYAVDETVSIKKKGNYVRDLLLLPVYSEELMSSSGVNGSSTNLSLSVGDPVVEVAANNINGSKDMNTAKGSGFYSLPVNYLLIALLTLILLSAAGYQLFRKQKKIGETSQEEKTAHKTKYFSEPANTLEPSVKVPDKMNHEHKKDFQAYTEASVSIKGQVTEPESETSVIESGTELKHNNLERKGQAESREKFAMQKMDLQELRPEVKIYENTLEKLADNPEINTQDPKKKFLLPSDLQGVMDIIRGQGGRITQKELCSRLKCSDAKVSLMLADLERRGLIDKFKKGRGNVVILRDEER